MVRQRVKSVNHYCWIRKSKGIILIWSVFVLVKYVMSILRTHALDLCWNNLLLWAGLFKTDSCNYSTQD